MTKTIEELVTIEATPIQHKNTLRKLILGVEHKLSKIPGALFEDDIGELRHSFGDGLYIRELTVPKGMLIVTKIHKKTHPFFLLKGDCSILTDEGIVRIKAPYSGITKPGTKRVVYTHEDTVWTTVHATDKTDLKEIEEEVIAKNFDEILPTYDEILKLTEV